MSKIVKYEDVESKIIQVRNKNVILDSDVASLYGVETKRVNEAVKNNPEKFPAGYYFELTADEKEEVVEIFDHLQALVFSPSKPKAFTEKGLYMLATILKSPKATKTTLSIIETFTKVGEVKRAMTQIPKLPESSVDHQELMQKTGNLISNLILPEQVEKLESEASIEINLAVVKLRYQIKKKSK